MKPLGFLVAVILLTIVNSGCGLAGSPMQNSSHASGLGVTPSVISFGEVKVGTTASQTITIQNTGDAELMLSSATASGSIFSLSAAVMPQKLPAGGTLSFDINFTPPTAGTASGSVSLVSNAPTSPTLVNLSGNGVAAMPAISVSSADVSFGTVSIGSSQTQSIKISNAGDASLTVTAAKMGGSTTFGENGLTLPLTIAAGNSSNFNVKFAPTASGSVSGTMSLVSNAPTSPTVVSFSGSGGPAASPVISVSPGSVSFGAVTVGSKTTQSVTISNTGNASLTITAASLSGSAYKMSGVSLPLTIATGGESRLTVIFAPTSTGSASGSVSLMSNAPTSPTVVPFTGSGSGSTPTPGMSVSPTSLSFGNVSAGGSSTETLTVSNSGTAKLTVTAATISGSAFSTSGLTLPLTVSPGSSAAINVRFTPTSSASATGSLSLASNAPKSPTVIALLGSSESVAGHPALPVLPKSTPSTTYPTQTGTTWNVPAGNAVALQHDINSAACGDTVLLAAGSTYAGHFTLPAKNCSSTSWVVIRTSTSDSSLPQGIRVTPSQANLMAELQAPDDQPVLAVLPQAKFYWVVGIQFDLAPGQKHSFGLVTSGYLSDNNTPVSSASQLPSNVVFDRCYGHGGSTGVQSVRRWLMDGIINSVVMNSYISSFFDQVDPSDSQGIAVYNSPGPILILNNDIQAASENIIFGGTDPAISGLITSDATIEGNFLHKPTSWQTVSGLTVKDDFELKNAQRVLIKGNAIENNWPDGQQGAIVLFTPRNSNGRCTQCTVTDVTFTYNYVAHSAEGINISSGDTIAPDNKGSQPTARLLIQNNVLDDINSSTWTGPTHVRSNGYLFQILAEPNFALSHDITIDHNDGFQEGSDGVFLNAGDLPAEVQPFQFTNNITNYGPPKDGALIVQGHAAESGLERFFGAYTWGDDLLILANGHSDPNGLKWPSGTLFTTLSGVGMTDYGKQQYQLLNSSPYHDAGSDPLHACSASLDLGVCDWPTFNKLTSSALAGSSTE
jgi:hypothetical protein